MKLLRVGITLVLIGLVLYWLDLRQFGDVLASSNWWWVVPATLLQLTLTLLSAKRWQAILTNFRIRTSLGSLIQLAFIGSFFNLCLPSAIGGDVFRAFYLSKRTARSMTTTLMSTLLERSGGLCALLMVGAAAALYWGLPAGSPVPGYLFPVMIAVYLLINLALFHSRLHRLFTRILKRLGLGRLEERMELVYEGLRTLIRNRGALVEVLAVSLVIQLGSVAVVWTVSHALPLQQPLPVFLVLIPIINLSIMVPVTINGFGLREGLYFLLFAALGVPEEQAVALSLLNTLAVALAALPGGVVYSLYKRDPGFEPGELVNLPGGQVGGDLLPRERKS